MKRKLYILCLLAALSTGMRAADYSCLLFTLSDGTVQGITSTDLNMTFADGILTVTNGTNTLELNVVSLTKMEFTDDDPTGISSIDLDSLEPTEATAIYDLSGRQMPQGRKLPQGTYIMKTNGMTIKVQIRK